MNQGTYIGLKATPETQRMITKRYGKLGVHGVIGDMHITLMYDRNNNKVDDYQTDPKKTFTAIVTGASVMGEKDSEWRAIALHLRCPELSRKHYAIRRAYSLEHSYPKYKCHMSIKYKPSDVDEEIVLDDAGIIGQRLQFSAEYVEPINE